METPEPDIDVDDARRASAAASRLRAHIKAHHQAHGTLPRAIYVPGEIVVELIVGLLLDDMEEAGFAEDEDAYFPFRFNGIPVEQTFVDPSIIYSPLAPAYPDPSPGADHR